MTVYIIIVTYNAKDWLGYCLPSLQNRPQNWQVIVADNASTDGTAESIKQQYPWVRLVKSGQNLGFGRGNNIGLRLALAEKADHVLLLNQDARIELCAIEALVGIQQNNPDYFIVSPVHLRGDGEEVDLAFSKYCSPPSCPGLLKNALDGRLEDVYETKKCNAAIWLLSRRCLQTVGGFNPVFFHYNEDDDYCNRVRFFNGKIGIAPKVRARHNRPQKASTRPLDNYFLNTLVKFTDPARKPPSAYRLITMFIPTILKNITRGRRVIAGHFASVLKDMLKNQCAAPEKRNPSRIVGPTYLNSGDNSDD